MRSWAKGCKPSSRPCSLGIGSGPSLKRFRRKLFPNVTATKAAIGVARNIRMGMLNYASTPQPPSNRDLHRVIIISPWMR